MKQYFYKNLYKLEKLIQYKNNNNKQINKAKGPSYIPI